MREESRNKLVTLAVYDSIIDVSYNLLKNMLDEAGIQYFVNNEYSNISKPMFTMMPTNLSIDIKVYEEDLKEATAILESIRR